MTYFTIKGSHLSQPEWLDSWLMYIPSYVDSMYSCYTGNNNVGSRSLGTLYGSFFSHLELGQKSKDVKILLRM